MNNKKVILAILDGWGIKENYAGNAVALAQTPCLDEIENKYFTKTLQASGIAVGLLWGREGNSEVGHANLGAGRVMYQYLPRIVEAIRDNSFFENPALKKASAFIKNNNSALHIMGLVSSGTVHSYIDHLYALLEFAARENIKRTILHIFTDGKDGAPNEAKNFILDLKERIKKYPNIKIGSIIGRLYAMDRNNNWNFTKTVYDALTKGEGEKITDITQYITQSYEEGLTDFNIRPAIIYENENSVELIKENDAVIFFNFREDSARQITRIFIEDTDELNTLRGEKPKKIVYVGMTKYLDDLPMEVAFPPIIIANPLARILSDAGKKQLHIAESEKYAHVTYFFNGQNEKAYFNEDRIVIPSTGSEVYAKFPEMQADRLTDKLIENIDKYDFFLINFANADILAHTGNIEVTKKGIEAIDRNIAKLKETAENKNITLIVTSDHGHAEEMLEQKTGRILTKHSLNPVPIYIVGSEFKQAGEKFLEQETPQGILADVAPTVLKLMSIPIPEEMNGTPLF